MRRAIAHIRGNWRAQPEIEADRGSRRRHADRTASSVPPLGRADAEGLPAGAHARQRARAAARFRERARRLLRGRPVRARPAARPVRHARSDVAGRMEGRRRRPDDLLRLPPLAVRHRAGDGDASAASAGLAFADAGEEKAALADMRAPLAEGALRRGHARAPRRSRARIFDPKLWRPDRPLRVVLIGTDFEVRVWETLLRIPMGRATTYSDIAAKIGKPKAARAVGAAVGKNPICFVVPCHRVHRQDRRLTGYHWGLTRKRAMLGWEAGTGRGVAAHAVRFAPRRRIASLSEPAMSNAIEAEAPPGDAGRPGRLGLARGARRQRRPPGQHARPSTGCGPAVRTPSCGPTAAMSACRPGRWAIPRSAISTSAPAAW